MTIALMQPYFFPYIGQFQIINAVDRFILVDELQHIQAGWIHRNRILKPNGGWQYIILPIGKHKLRLNTLIKDIQVVENGDWKRRILGQVEHYKKMAPFYRDVCNVLQECFHSTERNITKLNGSFFKVVCTYLGIPFKLEISSEMNFDYSTVTDKEDRGIKMCRQIGAHRLINPPGGINLYSKENFRQNGVQLEFLQPDLSLYDQRNGNFEPGLSIIDVMMFNSPSDIKTMLNAYRLL